MKITKHKIDYFLLLMPGLILFGLLIMLPILLTIVYSFFKISFLTNQFDYVGFKNFLKLLHKKDFYNSLQIVLTLTIIAVIFSNLIGIIFAKLFNKNNKIFIVLRVLIFTPFILSPIVVGYTFSSILTDKGILNQFLNFFSITHDISWLGDSKYALISISIALCWQLVAFCTVIYLACLKNIPSELEDAVNIDGANNIQKFRYLDWPLLAPALTINTVVILISSFKLYDRVLALTGGGPGRSTETISMLIIRTAFNENRVGFASSMSLILLILSGITTFVALIYLGKREVTI
ncbi:MAG: sugar ABC transporter permease [Pelagibacteraceae bacterium]|nr:sugar ABC transporter permease [Pelagibacteraceae bacterium]MBT4645217.1 sugar ABC transporter permease [Pelagibacteraceae bacterium]MBT4951125.1 sugar ABC transporter permease [Pelagibacteraceae bacterium]MBT5213963.1 sugar ABC transporter permease [Pelagibacteraceae bacterium]MBT6355040.1 sugar ABC transporter permease [Pelagibacteraceae bacterium]